MSPEEVTKLRGRLGYSMSGLARALGVPVDDVVAWESGERFPTRRAVEAMRRLDEERANPPDAQRSAKPTSGPSWSALKDPELWTLFRKLAAWPELQRRSLELAAEYEDPADSEG